MVTTRIADISDFDWIYNECIDFSKTYPSKLSLTGNEEYAKFFIKNMLENKEAYVVIVSENDRKLTGFIAGMIAPHHFNPDIRVLSELFWWVPVKYRGTRAGALLLNQFMKFGEENCDWINFTLEETTPISDKALAKRGFKLTERAYLKEVR